MTEAEPRLPGGTAPVAPWAGITLVPPAATGGRGTAPVPIGPGELGAGTGGPETGPLGPMPVEVEASPPATRRAICPMAAAVGYRAAGSLAIARSTTWRTVGGMSFGSGAGCERTCCIAISSGLSPSNGRRPTRHLHAPTPSAYTSDRGVATAPLAC